MIGSDVSLSTYPACATFADCRLPPKPAGSSCYKLTLIDLHVGRLPPFAPRELPRFTATNALSNLAPTEQPAHGLRVGTFGLSGADLAFRHIEVKPPVPINSDWNFIVALSTCVLCGSASLREICFALA